MKTFVPPFNGPDNVNVGTPAIARGGAVAGLPGLRRIEYWLRPDAGANGELADDDPAWQTARWLPGVIDAPPEDWTDYLPMGVSPREIWGFDPAHRQAEENGRCVIRSRTGR